MNIKQIVLAGLMLPSLLMVAPVWAVNLSNQTINSVQKNFKPAVPGNAVIKKTSPANAIHLNTTQACPKLFAKGLRVVRVIPQPVRGGVQTYRFILDGNIANRGAAGVANAGFNVTQSVQGKPGKRIALKLFKQQVRKKQVLNVSRDLRVTIQSDALSRAQASRTVFRMNVTNLRNERGACGEYNPTVSTLSAAQVSRALPAQVRGVSQQAGVIPPAARPPARPGFAAPAFPANKSSISRSPGIGLSPQHLSAPRAGLPGIKKTQPLVPGKQIPGKNGRASRPTVAPMQAGRQKPGLKPGHGFGLTPLPSTEKPINGRRGFSPGVSPVTALQKPVPPRGGQRRLTLPEPGGEKLSNRKSVRGFALAPLPGTAKHRSDQGGFTQKSAAGKPGQASNRQHATTGGFAPVAPTSGRQVTSATHSTPGHTGGGFAPVGLARQTQVSNVLSAQQIAQIDGRAEMWANYKHAMEERRWRDEAVAQARMERLSREAYLSGADCDDTDAEIHPGLLEVCDHKDNNCDGRVDEGVTTLAYEDADGDRHGAGLGLDVCASDIRDAQRNEHWLSDIGNDCDDHDPDHWHDCPASESTR